MNTSISEPMNILTSSVDNYFNYNLYCSKQLNKERLKKSQFQEKKKPQLLTHPPILNQYTPLIPMFHSNTAIEKKPHSSSRRSKSLLNLKKPNLSCSYAVHEDELWEEMKSMAKNHKIAKERTNTLQNTIDSCENDETRRLFISNALTMKFLNIQDTVLITVSDELQISQFVDPSFHLKVGKIVSILHFDEECLVELVNSNNSDKLEQIIIPSFCLCLEDRVLFERMQLKRNQMVLQRKSKSCQDFCNIEEEILAENVDKQEQINKPRRKFKSC